MSKRDFDILPGLINVEISASLRDADLDHVEKRSLRFLETSDIFVSQLSTIRSRICCWLWRMISC